jgi:hypothetical protein
MRAGVPIAPAVATGRTCHSTTSDAREIAKVVDLIQDIALP